MNAPILRNVRKSVKQVFSFSLVLAGIPVGTLAIALIGIGFVMNFVFANFEGNVIKSILERFYLKFK